MIAPQEVRVGQTITFQGYADDFGSPITTVEFSLDDGATWASCDTSGADADRAIQWSVAVHVNEPGHGRLKIRARSADGRTSPECAVAEFYAG